MIIDDSFITKITIYRLILILFMEQNTLMEEFNLVMVMNIVLLRSTKQVLAILQTLQSLPGQNPNLRRLVLNWILMEKRLEFVLVNRLILPFLTLGHHNQQ